MEIKKICLLGAGLMGNGIAQACAQAGYEVSLRDIEQRFVDNGMNYHQKESGPRCGKRQEEKRVYGCRAGQDQTHAGSEGSSPGRGCGR